MVILTLKKAFCPCCQNPLAHTSGFALTPVRLLMISPSGCNRGLIPTSLQISVSNWASNCNKTSGFAVQCICHVEGLSTRKFKWKSFQILSISQIHCITELLFIQYEIIFLQEDCKKPVRCTRVLCVTNSSELGWREKLFAGGSFDF